MDISFSVSAGAIELLCGTSSAMTRADLVGTTLKGTVTFVSRINLNELLQRSAFENVEHHE